MNDELPTKEILDKFFYQSGGPDATNTLIRHQIESMNEFLDKKLIQIIQGFNSIQVYHNYSQDIKDFKYKIIINVTQPSLTKPVYQTTDGTQMLMTPNLARVNNLTYASSLYIDVNVITDIINDDGITERKETVIPNVCIGKLPIMVKSKACILTQMPDVTSGECRYDFGGYFIVNGNEKVIICQDRISENKTLIFQPNGNGDGLFAEIRSMPDGIFLPPKTTSLHLSGKSNHMGNVIKLTASFIRSEIPLFVMFRALGIESDKEIYAHIILNLESKKDQRIFSQLAACAEDAYDIHTQVDAIQYLLKVLGTTGNPKEYLEQPEKAVAIVKNTIKNDFLSHVGPSFRKKALYLGSMVKKLLMIHMGYMEYDNRDSYLHKRIDTPGILYSNLFRQCYGKMIKEVRNLIVRELNLWRANPNTPLQLITVNNVHRFFKQNVIETGLRYALSTGNWGIKSIGSFQNIRQGVAQMYSRMSYLSSLSHLRRINTPMEKNGKLVQPRKLENSQFGVICPNECFAPNTPILMWNGTIKQAKDIIVGDYLIDDNGNSIYVRSTCSGYKTMYDIIPTKKNFISYTVTDNHILTLKIRQYKTVINHTKLKWFDKKALKYRYKQFNNYDDLQIFGSKIDNDDVIDITIDRYLSLPRIVRKQLYTFKSGGINWESKLVQDPYVLGMKIRNKKIPFDYLINDRKTRLELLAGIIDSNGIVRANVHEILISQDEYIYDIEFLTRSLGFSCCLNDYNELIITGENLCEIPFRTKIDNLTSVNKPKNYMQSSFKLIKKNIEPFVGWQVEGSGRFLLSDMSVVHNTPEGAAVGLVKNMALSTHITVNISSIYVRKMIEELGTKIYDDNIIDPIAYLKRMGSEDTVTIIINGDIIGYHENPVEFYNQMRHFKRYGSIPPMTSIVWDIKNSTISMSTEAGRMARPLYIVNSGVLELIRQLSEKSQKFEEFSENKTFQQFISPLIDDTTEGFIEYLDVDEIDKAMLAMVSNDLNRGIKGKSLPPKFTHCEIHPSLINGILAANIPFMDHNQAPRNCYQCLWVEEPVLCSGGNVKAIKNITIDDKVICFNPITMIASNTKVIHQYVRPAMKPVYRIITISGRVIVATQDHKFITNQGWRDVTGFNSKIKFGIYPMPKNIIIGEDSNIPVNFTNIEKDIEYIKFINLYPIAQNDYRVSIIARILGFNYSNKNLMFASKQDMDRYDDDIRLIGFKDGHRDHKFITFLSILLKEIVKIPDWINNGSLLIKREFISGYFSNNIIKRDDIKEFIDINFPNAENFIDNFTYSYNYYKTLVTAREAEYYRYIKYNKDPMSLQEWNDLIELKGNLMFVPYSKVIQMRNIMISDITVDSDNHSFIGGDGFAVSNSAMGKQAVGIYMSNYNERLDTLAHVLHYPQKPIVRTMLSKYTYSDEMPYGINAVVAIMTHTGFNQEDSVMINQSSLDRGLFTSTYFKTYRDQCSKNHSTGEEEVFTKPIVEETGRVKPYNYDKLNEDGFIPKNTAITQNDILVGKIMPYKSQGVTHARDTSLQVKGNDEGNIDYNYTGINGDGYKFCKIRLRKYRKVVVGDKLACYTKDHDILTTDGWISISELTVKHKVATMVDDALVYQNPIELQNYDYKGKMYSLESNQVSLLVTPNHRMYVMGEGKYKVDKAEDIFNMRKRYKKNINNWNPNYNSLDLPWNLVIENGIISKFRFDNENEIDINLWITLYGVYIKEGSSDKEINGWHMDNTHLQEWTYWLNQEQSRKLVDTIFIGDEEEKLYYTSSNELADNFQRLCLHAGYSCNKYIKSDTNYWTLKIIIKENEPIVNKWIDKKFMDKWVDFDDKVFCCTVPRGEGIIYVRRNGLTVWSGQSRSAQKGCVGMIYHQSDMPFSKSGITPDIIMNPHAIPSRMTMAQLMECIMGKACCYIGARGDSTPFTQCSVESIASVLEQSGYERYGNEILYNGRTGEQIQTEIFIGPTYYQRLKHMVADKQHVRGSNGPIVMLTRQPAEGRARAGGLRFGEMERDGIVAHGAASFLKERMLDVSDNFRVFICRKCGLIATANPEKNIYKCNNCKNNANINQVRMPYSMKLLLQELLTMSVAGRIIV